MEKQWNSQLARRWVLTIPREIPPDQYAVLVREFCQKQFVSKGMIADFAIHDTHPPGHNPHAHVLLTMRAMDEHGKWLPKSRKVEVDSRKVNVDFSLENMDLSEFKEKATFRNCRFYRSEDVLFIDMEVFKGQGNDTKVLSIDRNDIYLIYCYLF